MRFSALCVLCSALALACAAPASAAVEFGGPLTGSGRTFQDPYGRTVVLHGLFAVWKQPPYAPAGADDPAAPQSPSFTEGDADIVRGLGVDAVRLAWNWEGIEPDRGRYDNAYLERIAAVQSKLAARGVYTVLDSHQDQFNKLFGDKPGFPAWAAFYDGLEIAPAPDAPGYSSWKFPLGYSQPSTQRAFASLYANREGLWDAYGKMWQRVAKRFRAEPMVAGYDVMNEPYPTDASCSGATGCPAFDRTVLQPFETAIAKSLGAVDDVRTVFYEPTIFFNSGKPNGFVAPGAGVPPAGLSFHNQCSTRVRYSITKDPSLIDEGHRICPAEETTTMRNADTVATRFGGPPLMTEVAPTSDDDVQGLNCLLERADRFQTGFTYGLSWSNPDKELRRLTSESAADGKAPFKQLVLARTYPRAIAGTPVTYGFDVRTGRFALRYRTRAGTSGLTVIAAPAIQYPGGYVVRVTGGRATSKPGAALLTVANDAGAKTVSVEVTPKPAGDAARPSFPACTPDPSGGKSPAAPAPLLGDTTATTDRSGVVVLTTRLARGATVAARLEVGSKSLARARARTIKAGPLVLRLTPPRSARGQAATVVAIATDARSKRPASVVRAVRLR